MSPLFATIFSVKAEFMLRCFEDLLFFLKQVSVFAAKLELIAQGKMVEAARVQLAKDDEEGPGINLSDDDVDTMTDNVNLSKGGVRQSKWTSSQLSAAREVIHRFLEDMPKTKCENCLAHVPTIKQAGVGKIFQV